MNSFQSNNRTNLFGGSGGGGGGLFGGNNNNNNSMGNSGGSGTPMFGGKNTPNKGGMFGGGSSGGTGNSLFGGGGGGGLGNLGGNQQVGTVGVRYNPPKNKENIALASITTQNECRGKCLDELRIEDYRLTKNNQLPADVVNKIKSNMQGGSTGMGSLSGNLMGGGNSMGGGGGGGLFGGNNNSSGGGGGLPSLSLSRGNVIPGSTGTGGGGLGGSSGGGGLFGGNNNNASGGGGGGLFGGNNNNSSGGGGGLFGNKGTGNTGGGGGLFGGNNNNSGGGGGGGLFGGNNNNSLGGGGGGLFGGNNNNSSGGGGGLFGNKGTGNTGGGGGLFGGGGNTSGGGGGGLFGGGGNTSGGGGGGLFGNKGTGNTGGGLFGNSGNNSGGGGGGLFGNSGNTSGGGGGGLFGGSGGGGGLFGGQNQGQGNSLFPNQQQQQGGQMYNADILRALFENMDPSWRAKLLESWQGKTDQTQAKDANAEKKDSNASGNTSSTASGTGTYVPYKPQEPKIDSKEQGYGRKKTLNELAASLANRSYYDQRSLLNESGSHLNNYSSYDIRGIKKIDDSSKSYSDGFGLPRRLGTHSVVRKLDHSQMNDHNSSYLDDHIEIQLRPKSLYSSKRILEDLNSSRASLNDSTLRKERKKNIYDNTATIEIEVVIQGKRLESVLKFQFDRNVPVADVKKRALELLNENGALASYAQAPRNLEEIANYAELSFNGYVLEDDRSIKEAALEDPVRVLLYISNERDAPKLTKAGYWTSPPIEELKKWDERSLKYVENFTVGNEHGTVQFLGETDVRGLDLDELVIIQHGFAEVYPEAKFPTEESKPRRGTKLNKPSIITLYNCFRKNGKSSKKRQELSTIQEDVEVLGYDEANGIYQMKVQHFTRYGFDASDDEEEEEEEIKQDFRSSKLPPQFGAFMSQGGVRGAEVQPQRRGIGFMEIDKDDDFVSQGSESIKLRDFITSGAAERQGKMLPDDELFEQSDEDVDTQFRGRQKFGQKAIKGNHGRIVVAPEPQEDEEVDDFEEELVKAPETETGGDAIEEKIEEETDYTLSKQSDLLNLADSFVATGRERVDWSGYVNNMSREAKTRCDQAMDKLGLLNRMTFEKIQGQINTRERPFYMNRSFRVGWTKDGLAMARTDGSVSLHKVVLHKEIGRQTPEDESAFDYERYKRNLTYLARNLYEPLMRSLISQSTNMEDLSQLSINDRRGEGRSVASVSSFLKFPDSNGVANALKDYVENIIDRRALREEGDETRKLIYADLRIRDLEVLSLFNTLFGNFELNLWEHALAVEDSNITQEERDDLARRMQRSAERERQNRFIRKHGLSKWLERKSGQFVEADLHDDRNIGLSLTGEILFYLSGKQIRRATEVCNANGLHNLAVLLSTLSTNTHSKEIIKQQLVEWEQSRVSSFIEYQDIYKFLSGNQTVLPLPDWTRLFGMDLWYFAKPNQPFDNIFANFYENKLPNDKKPAQSYFKNPLEEGPSDYDLAFILTGLHAKHKDFNTHKLLSPYTYTSDCLDVKFIWLIEEFLSNNSASAGGQSSDAMNIESSEKLTKEKIEFKYRVLHGFCYQLELLGLWEYAIYAILIASPQVLSDANKARYIRNIVQRNYKTTDIFNTDRRNQDIKKKGQKKEILIEQLGLKQNLLHESKAFKYLYSFRYTKAIKDFMKCGSWKKAYYTLCRKLAPSVICNSMTSKAGLERAKTSLNFLESQLGALETYRHTLETWEKEGSVILRVLREVLSQDNRLAGPQESLGARDVAQLVQLVNSLNDLEAIQENDLGRVMVDKFRRELGLALLNRLSQNQFAEQQEKILECVEQLNKNIKEDKTQIGLRFIERDLQI